MVHRCIRRVPNCALRGMWKCTASAIHIAISTSCLQYKLIRLPECHNECLATRAENLSDRGASGVPQGYISAEHSEAFSVSTSTQTALGAPAVVLVRLLFCRHINKSDGGSLSPS
eukprot:scaffold134073_cov19-Tisochrysis_lutea.AAC.1